MKSDPTLDFRRLPPGPERDDARSRAYAALFKDQQLGRIVLADILACCGVGEHKGPPRDALHREHQAARENVGLEIMEAAGFGQTAAVALVMKPEAGEIYDEQSEHVE